MDLQPLVLALVEPRPLYGYELVQLARRKGKLAWEEGTVYPLLHKMEGAGLLVSKWQKAPTGRKRKYYSLSRKGAKLLAQARREWTTQVKTVTNILLGGSHA